VAPLLTNHPTGVIPHLHHPLSREVVKAALLQRITRTATQVAIPAAVIPGQAQVVVVIVVEAVDQGLHAEAGSFNSKP